MNESEKTRQKAMAIIYSTFDLIGDAMVDSASIRGFNDLVSLRGVRDDLYQAFESIEKTPENVVAALSRVHVASLSKDCGSLVDDVLTSAALNADQCLTQDQDESIDAPLMMDEPVRDTALEIDSTVAVISEVKSWTDKMLRRVANIAGSPEELDKGVSWISELNDNLTNPLLDFYMNNFLSDNSINSDEHRKFHAANIIKGVVDDESNALINRCPPYLRGLVSSMTNQSNHDLKATAGMDRIGSSSGYDHR